MFQLRRKSTREHGQLRKIENWLRLLQSMVLKGGRQLQLKQVIFNFIKLNSKLANFKTIFVMKMMFLNSDQRLNKSLLIAGLNRCGKSCRLRWLNYLRPNIKRGNISDQEEDLILRLHKLLGNRLINSHVKHRPIYIDMVVLTSKFTYLNMVKVGFFYNCLFLIILGGL